MPGTRAGARLATNPDVVMAETAVAPVAAAPVTAPCANCGHASVEAFCAGCGQATPTPGDYSLGSFLRAAIGYVTNYDGRLLTTVRKLFFRPGQLARDHFEGRRASHLDPLRIFLLSNVFAWFVVPYTNMFGFSVKAGLRLAQFAEFWSRALLARASLSHLTVEQLATRVDAVSASENSVAVLCMMPLLAMGLWVTMAGRGYRFVQHVVFTAHVYCFHLFCVLLYLGILLRPLAHWAAAHAWSAPLAGPMVNIWYQHLALAPALIPYLYIGLKRAYLLSARESVWRAVVLAVWACTVTRLFFDVAFAIVLIRA